MNCQSQLYYGQSRKLITRRWFFEQCGVGLGAIALGQLFAQNGWAAASTNPLAPKAPPLPARAKRVIFLFMAGAPSHLELFDYKPELAKWNGKLPPAELVKGYRAAFINPSATLLGPKFKFAKHGQSGAELSELLPHLAGVADDIAIVKSMYTDAFNHAPGQIFMNTGTQQFGRPSMGAWVTYGLGSDARDLPGFVVLTSLGKGGQNQPIAARQWAAGFLPSRFQGVHLRGKGDPVLFLSAPPGVTRGRQQDVVGAVNAINAKYDSIVDDPEIATRIAQYEMAFQMQSSVPELMEINKEPQDILDLYGGNPGDGSFASNCLLARRLAERGVRFIQLYHKDWDHHGGVKEGVTLKALEVDRACMALITDLKRRDMLKDTLIVWAGEFGRTPMSQGGDGRDHHNAGFSIWLCGGGIKPGLVYGATDELGYAAVENPVDVHDLHATMLRLLGIEHTRLTVKFQGLDARLTNVSGKVIEGILA